MSEGSAGPDEGADGARESPREPSTDAVLTEEPPLRVRRLLVRLSAALAGEDGEGVEASLDRLAAMEAYHRHVEEALLQAYLFLGFPTVLDAFREWRERVPAAGPAERSGAGGAVEEAGSEEDLTEWSRRGRKMCRRVYGSAYERLRRNVTGLHPALDRWMVQEGYGKVLSREGLDPGTRETCIVAVLAATGREPQLHSHLRGALRLDVDPADVDDALEAGLSRSAARTGDSEWPRRARWLWNGIRPGGRPGGGAHGPSAPPEEG